MFQLKPISASPLPFVSLGESVSLSGLGGLEDTQETTAIPIIKQNTLKDIMSIGLPNSKESNQQTSNVNSNDNSNTNIKENKNKFIEGAPDKPALDVAIKDQLNNSYGNAGYVIDDDYILNQLGDPLDNISVNSGFVQRDPIGGYNVSKKTGKQWNIGVDLAAKYGDPVKSTGNGKIVEAGKEKDGNQKVTVEIESGGVKYYTQFNHLSNIGVKIGDSISRGQILGKAGNSGITNKDNKDPHSGTHVDYMIYRKDDKNNYYFIDSSKKFN